MVVSSIASACISAEGAISDYRDRGAGLVLSGRIRKRDKLMDED